MEKSIVSKFMRLLVPLSVDIKLEILSKLSTHIKKEYKTSPNNKQKLLEELCGAWSDMEDSMSDDLLKARTTSNKDISFN